MAPTRRIRFYLRWLRKAHEHLTSGTRQLCSSPNKKAKVSSSTAILLFDEEDDNDVGNDGTDGSGQHEDDAVAIKVARWKPRFGFTVTSSPAKWGIASSLSSATPHWPFS